MEHNLNITNIFNKSFKGVTRPGKKNLNFKKTGNPHPVPRKVDRSYSEEYYNPHQVDDVRSGR